jgi:filamentous hemagglutinin family protein
MIHKRSSWSIVWVLALFALFPFLSATGSEGQTTSITSSGLNTNVTTGSIDPAGRQNYDITGGTRPGNGANLFHSFGDFSIGTNNVARFLNDSGLATTNILSRVTGGHVSNIFGEISTANFPGANFYLINPAGVVFGPSASLNVSGSVNISTADYLRLTDGVRFNAVPGPQDTLLSTAPVAAFGFLNLAPRPISVQGNSSGPTLSTGKDLSLVGGNIDISRTVGVGGNVNLVSVASRGEVRTNAGTGGPLELSGFDTLGQISMNEGGYVLAGGSMEIRGGELLMSGRGSGSGLTSAGPVTVNVSDSITLQGGFPGSNIGGSRVTLNAGRAITTNGDSDVRGDSSVSITGPDVSILGRVRTASDDGGSITIQANTLFINGSSGPGTLTGILAPGASHGGTIVINADQARISEARINVDSSAGQAGNIAIRAGEISIDAGSAIFIASRISASSQSGNAGNIVIESGSNLRMGGGVEFGRASLMAESNGGNGGTIILQAAQQIDVSGTRISTEGRNGQPGQINISAGDAVRIDGSHLTANNNGVGPAGTLTINAGTTFVSENSTFVAQTGEGHGGTISVTAPDLVRFTNSQVNTSVDGSAASVGGTITIASDVVRLQNSQVLSNSVEGNGGTITIKTNAFVPDEPSTVEAVSLTGHGANGTFTVEPF